MNNKQAIEVLEHLRSTLRNTCKLEKIEQTDKGIGFEFEYTEEVMKDIQALDLAIESLSLTGLGNEDSITIKEINAQMNKQIQEVGIKNIQKGLAKLKADKERENE